MKEKEYEVFIDISEIFNVKAKDEEEAKQKVIDQYNESNCSWTIDDAVLTIEEVEE